MRTLSLVEHIGGGQESRFYIDGIRVSRDRMETVKIRAYMAGGLSCFHTSGKQRPEGRTRRTNRSLARY